jgi:RNA polymerase sigma-70 factor (ECF subfamily)
MFEVPAPSFMNKDLPITAAPDVHRCDDEAFREIYNQYYTRLCFFASRLLPGCSETDDIVQEVFLKLWIKWEDIYDPKSIKAFLYISVKNSCLNSHKHKKVVRKYYKLNNVEPEEDVIASHIVEAEVLQLVHRKLEKMPQGCRNVMQLSYFQGMKDKDIAERLNVSINTVKTQKKRGLSLLRIAFKLTSLFAALISVQSE